MIALGHLSRSGGAPWWGSSSSGAYLFGGGSRRCRSPWQGAGRHGRPRRAAPGTALLRTVVRLVCSVSASGARRGGWAAPGGLGGPVTSGGKREPEETRARARGARGAPSPDWQRRQTLSSGIRRALGRGRATWARLANKVFFVLCSLFFFTICILFELSCATRRRSRAMFERIDRRICGTACRRNSRSVLAERCTARGRSGARVGRRPRRSGGADIERGPPRDRAELHASLFGAVPGRPHDLAGQSTFA